MNSNSYSPENYIHNLLPNVLISTDDDPIVVFKLALSLTKICNQMNNTICTVVGEECHTVGDAVKAVKDMSDMTAEDKLRQKAL